MPERTTLTSKRDVQIHILKMISEKHLGFAKKIFRIEELEE